MRAFSGARWRQALAFAVAMGVIAALAAVVSARSAQASPKPGTAGKHYVVQQDAIHGRAPWLSAPASLTGRVLHWQQVSYFDEVGAIDPANGQRVITDVWMLVGSNGVPMSTFGTASFVDGRFYQAWYETATLTTNIYGRVYAPFFFHVPGHDAAWCINQVAMVNDMASRLPAFVVQAQMSTAGFRLSTVDAPRLIPTTSVPTGLTPVTRYAERGIAQSWTRQTTSRADAVTTTRLDVAPDGRVVRDANATSDATGATLRDQWMSFGTLDVYDPAAVPNAFLTINSALAKGCTR